MTKNALPAEILENIKASSQDALRMLQLSEDHQPMHVVAAIDLFVRGWQANPDEVKKDQHHQRMVISLSSLWGIQLNKEFGWDWGAKKLKDGDTLGVFSPDNSMAIYTVKYLNFTMQNPAVIPTIELAFNMIKDKALPKFAADSYTDVMAGVRHIVPPAN